MGQHKNQTQVEIFLTFMERHPDLAKNFVHGDKVFVEQLWVELANELNASGPPTKQVQAWKKVWIDMKLNVKQRMGHNRVEASKTGGGRFNKYILSPYDEQIATICGLYVPVDGIEGTRKCGVPQKKAKLSATAPSTSTNADVLKPAASTSIPTPKPAASTPILMPQNENIDVTQIDSRSPTPTSSRISSRKRKSNALDVGDVIAMESEQFSNISANIGKIQGEMKENQIYFKEISRNIREIRRLKEKELEETKRHNYETEKCLKSKNELKLQFLELERLKLGITSPQNY